MSPIQPYTKSPDHLPPPLVSAAFGLMLLVLLARPFHDTDIYWQLKFGELLLDTGRLPDTEPFLADRQGEPVTPVYWLGQAGYAELRRVGGWPLLRAVDAMLWLGGFVAVAAPLWRRRGAALPVAVAVGIGFMAAMPFASLRAQSFGVLAFGVTLAVAGSGMAGWAKVLTAAVVGVLWQNAHPSVVVGAAAVGATAAAGWLLWLSGRRPAPWAETGMAAALAAATIVTPMGFGVFTMAGANAAAARLMRTGEWLPMWYPNNVPANLTTAAAFAAVGWLLVRNRGRVSLTDLAPALLFAGLTLYAYRFALFWGVAVVPLLAKALTPADAPPAGANPVRRSAAAAAAMLVGLAPLLWPAWYADYMPLTGVERLNESGVYGTVYCHHMAGGLIADTGFPDRRPTHDGRFYAPPREGWDGYLRAGAGEVPVEAIEAAYRPAAFLLHPAAQGGLVARLRDHPGWREVYADRNSVLFLPR